MLHLYAHKKAAILADGGFMKQKSRGGRAVAAGPPHSINIINSFASEFPIYYM